MKKFFAILLCCVMILSSVTLYATDTVVTSAPENSEDALVTGTPENVDDAVLISEDDYNDIESEGYTQSELKEAYDLYMDELETYFNDTYKRTPGVKAKVVAVEPVETEYEVDYYYYMIYKVDYQNVTLSVLEGGYNGQEVSLKYPLTRTGNDPLGHIQNAKLDIGDVVYVTISADEDGNTVAAITDADVSIQRYPSLILILAIALVLVLVYTGLKGAKSLVLSILTLDIVFLVLLPLILESSCSWIIVLVCAIAIAVVNVLLRKGWNRGSLIAVISTVLALVLVLVLTMTFNMITKTTGTTLISLTSASSLLTINRVDFTMIFISTIMIIAAYVLSNIACKTVGVGSNDVREVLSNSKEIISDRMNAVITFLGVLMIPSVMYLVSIRYTFFEMINSEILISELVRILVLIIGVVITVPLTAIFMKLMIKKDEKNVQNQNNVVE